MWFHLHRLFKSNDEMEETWSESIVDFINSWPDDSSKGYSQTSADIRL
jgi:hypothetical protein